MIYNSNKRYPNNYNIEIGTDIEKNEEFFWNINSVQDLINAERDGFPRFRLSTSSKMPKSSMLHQAARICNLELIEEFMFWGEFEVNQLDGNNCTPLGYIVNEVLENNFILFKKNQYKFSNFISIYWLIYADNLLKSLYTKMVLFGLVQ